MVEDLAVHDRGVNAARNVLAAGPAVAAWGDGVRPQRSTPGGRSSVKQEVESSPFGRGGSQSVIVVPVGKRRGTP
ncbi:hypothetical protein B6264_20360 [Kitasatospora aureofaciens]|nr:hypothetical protein B6264_20360 [Kitasatospora aureofaciens]